MMDQECNKCKQCNISYFYIVDFSSFEKIKKLIPACDQQRAAEGVISRTIPDRAADFIVQINPDTEPVNRQTFRVSMMFGNCMMTIVVWY